MNYVEPIRNKEVLSQIFAFLKSRNYRDYLMFLIGTNTGLRISDILKLKYKDIYNDVFYIKEQKTGKMKEIPINSVLKNEAKKIPAEQLNDYIFKSREGSLYITRQRAYQIIQEIGKEFKLDNLGTHTLRKTFGYHFYQDTKDVVTLMEIYNHSNENITLRYIGINRKMVQEAYRKFNLK